jgi:hypothetical protein
LTKGTKVNIFGYRFELIEDARPTGKNRFCARAKNIQEQRYMVFWNIKPEYTPGKDGIAVACDWDDPYEVYPLMKQ